MKWEEEGVRTLEDLATKKLTHQQQIGLKYFKEFEMRIPRSEMIIHEKLLKKAIKQIDPDIKVKLCGSFRRGMDTSGDIDVLCTHPKFGLAQKGEKKSFNLIDRIVKKLKTDDGYIIDELSKGQHAFMGVCKLPKEKSNGERTARRIDIKLFPRETFYPALLHFTGSGEHNRQLSCIAINKGFKLSEYSLSPVGSTGVVGDPLPVASEKDIFDMLGVPYREPSQRSL